MHKKKPVKQFCEEVLDIGNKQRPLGTYYFPFSISGTGKKLYEFFKDEEKAFDKLYVTRRIEKSSSRFDDEHSLYFSNKKLDLSPQTISSPLVPSVMNNSSNFVLVKAPDGSGKTVSAWRLYQQYLYQFYYRTDWQSDSCSAGVPFPCFFDVPGDFKNNLEPDQVIAKELKELDFSGTHIEPVRDDSRDDFSDLLGPFVLIFDDIDKISEEKREKITREFSHFYGDLREYNFSKIIFTSAGDIKIPGVYSPEVENFEIAELNSAAQIKIIQKWRQYGLIDPRCAELILDEWLEKPSVRQMCKIPVYLDALTIYAREKLKDNFKVDTLEEISPDSKNIDPLPPPDSKADILHFAAKKQVENELQSPVFKNEIEEYLDRTARAFVGIQGLDLARKNNKVSQNLPEQFREEISIQGHRNVPPFINSFKRHQYGYNDLFISRFLLKHPFLWKKIVDKTNLKVWKQRLDMMCGLEDTVEIDVLKFSDFTYRFLRERVEARLWIIPAGITPFRWVFHNYFVIRKTFFSLFGFGEDFKSISLSDYRLGLHIIRDIKGTPGPSRLRLQQSKDYAKQALRYFKSGEPEKIITAVFAFAVFYPGKDKGEEALHWKKIRFIFEPVKDFIFNDIFGSDGADNKIRQWEKIILEEIIEAENENLLQELREQVGTGESNNDYRPERSRRIFKARVKLTGPGTSGEFSKVIADHLNEKNFDHLAELLSEEIVSCKYNEYESDGEDRGCLILESSIEKELVTPKIEKMNGFFKASCESTENEDIKVEEAAASLLWLIDNLQSPDSELLIPCTQKKGGKSPREREETIKKAVARGLIFHVKADDKYIPFRSAVIDYLLEKDIEILYSLSTEDKDDNDCEVQNILKSVKNFKGRIGEIRNKIGKKDEVIALLHDLMVKTDEFPDGHKIISYRFFRELNDVLSEIKLTQADLQVLFGQIFYVENRSVNTDTNVWYEILAGREQFRESEDKVDYKFVRKVFILLAAYVETSDSQAAGGQAQKFLKDTSNKEDSSDCFLALASRLKRAENWKEILSSEEELESLVRKVFTGPEKAEGLSTEAVELFEEITANKRSGDPDWSFPESVKATFRAEYEKYKKDCAGLLNNNWLSSNGTEDRVRLGEKVLVAKNIIKLAGNLVTPSPVSIRSYKKWYFSSWLEKFVRNIADRTFEFLPADSRDKWTKQLIYFTQARWLYFILVFLAIFVLIPFLGVLYFRLLEWIVVQGIFKSIGLL